LVAVCSEELQHLVLCSCFNDLGIITGILIGILSEVVYNKMKNTGGKMISYIKGEIMKFRR
jgi:uncharacterized membrane protein